MTTTTKQKGPAQSVGIGNYSSLKLYQERRLREDKVMYTTLKSTVLHHWTRNQKDWVLRQLDLLLDDDFKRIENSILSIKEWEESGKKKEYQDWINNHPKYHFNEEEA